MNTSDLTPFGAAFLEFVQAKWPEFADHISVDEHGSLVIDYPSPHRPDGAALWLSADVHLDEVIIAFGGGHSHGGEWSDPNSADYHFKSTEQFITGILTEKVVGCVLRSGGGAIGDLDSMKTAPYWADVLSVKSWKGTHDSLA